MKQTQLTLDEKERLSEYRLSFQRNDENNDLTISISDLLNYDQLDQYIDKVQQKIAAPNKMVATSMFSKRYTYLVTVPALYSLAILNKQFNYSTNNIILESSELNGKWLPNIYYLDDKVLSPESINERIECRSQIIQNLFANHLNVMWEHLSKIGKISKQTLWENTAIYIFYIYESLLKEDLSEEIRNQVMDDFHFTLLKAGGHLFGDYNRNPLMRYYTEKTVRDGIEVRVRKTCCFYYKMSEEAQMCKSCPKNC